MAELEGDQLSDVKVAPGPSGPAPATQLGADVAVPEPDVLPAPRVQGPVAPPQVQGPMPPPAPTVGFESPAMQATIGPDPLKYRFPSDTRSMVESNLYLIDPSLRGNKTAINGIIERLEAGVDFGSVSEYERLVVDDTLKSLSMTTDGYIDLQIKLRETEGVPELEAASRSAIQTYSETHASVFSQGQLFADQDAVGMEYTNAAYTADDILQEIQIDTPGMWPAHRDDQRDLRAIISAGTSRSGLWKLDDTGTNLAIAFTDPENQQGDVQSWSGLVRLEPGTIIETTADAIAAYALAADGIKHTWEGDDVPGPAAKISIAGSLGNTIRFVETHGFAVLSEGIKEAWLTTPFGAGIESSRVDEALGQANEGLSPYAQAAQAQVAHLRGESVVEVAAEKERIAGFDEYSADLVSEEALAADISQALINDGAAPGEAAVAAYEGVQAMAAADPDFLAEARTKTADELMADFRQREDERGILQTFLVDDVLSPVMEAAAAYDHAVHIIGLTILATPDAIQNELDAEGSTTFKSAFEDAYADENVATYLGIEPDSPFAVWVNLGASILFDPITWFTPGARASWGWSKELLTNPRMAGKLLTQPHYRSAVRQIVQKQDSRLAWSFMGGGMGGDDMVRLLEIAGDDIPKAAQARFAKETIGILERNITDGLYLPAGPGRLKFIKDIQGIRAPFQNAGRLNDAGKSRLSQILIRTSRDRGASLTDNYLDDALSAIIMRNPDEPLRQAEMLDDALNAWKAHKTGSPTSVAAQTQRVEQVKRELGNLARKLDAPDLKVVPEYRKAIAQVSDEIDEAVRLGGDPGNVQAVRTRLQAHVDEFGESYDQAVADKVLRQKKLAQIETESQALLNPNDTSGLERWYHEFYDDWGRSLGLEDTDRINPVLRDRQLLDWSTVTGESTNFPTNDNIVGIAGWVGGDVTQSQASQTLANNLYNLGIGARHGTTILPASPFQVLAYANTPSKALYAQLIQGGSLNWASRGADMMQNVFASTVLLNLTTPVKTHLDEIIRFIDDAGFTSETLLKASSPRSIAGVDIPGTAVTSRSAQATREAATPGVHRLQPWNVVDPSTKGNWGAAERWVNGTMLNDDIFKAYARAVSAAGDDTEEAVRLFTKWWDEGVDGGAAGHVVQRRQFIDVGGEATDITGRTAFDTVEQGYKSVLNGAKPDVRVQFGDDLIDAAANGRKLDDYKPVQWRQFGPVPGQDASPQGILDRAFDMLYGTPSQRRGSVIYDHGYEYSLDVLETRFAGRIIDVDQVLKVDSALTPVEAAAVVNAGERSAIIRSLKARGYQYHIDLENAAARWATRYSDSMMYQMGAVSVLGKKMARFYPWGRAQFDYVGYWTKKMIEPAQFRIPGRSAVATPSVRVPSGVPGIGGTELNRVNIRLMDRIGHMIDLGNDLGDQERPDPYSPSWFIDTYSFLPSALDDAFVVSDLSVSPAPWVTNTMNWDFIPDEIRSVYEELHPSHRIFADYTNHGVDGIFNYLHAVAPSSSRSVRKTLEEFVKTLAGTPFVNPENPGINNLLNMLTIESEPPFLRDQLSLIAMAAFTEDAYSRDMVPSLDPDAPLNRRWTEMREQAYNAAYRREGPEFLRKQVGLPSSLGSEAMYAKAFLPLEGYLDDLVETGEISVGIADEFRNAVSVVGAGLLAEEGVTVTITTRQRKALIDAAFDILYHSDITDQHRNEFIIENTGAVVNMTHWQEVDFDKVPEEWRYAIQGTRIRRDLPTGIHSDLVKEGKKGDWVIVRDLEEWHRDAVSVAYRAGRGWLAGAWTEQTGLKWAQGKKDFLTLPLTVDAETAAHYGKIIERLRIDVGATVEQWEQDDGTWRTTYGDFKRFLTQGRTALDDGFGSENTDQAIDRTEEGQKFVADWKATLQWARDQGVEDVSEWEELEGAIEPRVGPDGNFMPPFNAAAEIERYRLWQQDLVSTHEAYSEADYERAYGWQLGPLNYEPPDPPAVADLDVAVSGGGDRFLAIDGDTIDFWAADGERVRFRLMGILAPEDPDINPDALKSKMDLQAIIDAADDVTIGMFDTDRYGTTQRFFSADDLGEISVNERVFGWLYIDGVPLWNPDDFTADNPRGVGIGGTIPEYQNWLDRERGVEPEGGVT